MRRTRPTLAALLVAVLLVFLMPSPAAADVYVPPPPPKIDPVYDIPSTWPAGTLSEEEAALRKHEIDLARRADSAKRWGTPAKLTKLGAVGLLGWFGFGWQIGVGSLTMYAVTTGDTENYCQTPEWYQDTFTPTVFTGPLVDCNRDIEYLNPNVDVTASLSGTYAGATITYKGTGTVVGGKPYFCYTQSAPVAAPVYAAWRMPNGSWSARGAWIADVYAGGCPPTGSTAGTQWRAVWAGSLYGDSQGSIGYLRDNGAQPATIIPLTATSGNPQRQARCAIKFDDGAPTIHSDWVPYTENDGFPAAAVGAACDAKSATLAPERTRHVRSIGIEEQTDGGSITEIAESEVPSEYDQQRDIMADQGTGRKALTLVRTIGTIKVDCLTSGNQCADWWTVTQQGTVPGEYKCWYGTAEVSLIECGVYRQSFQPGTQTPTITDPESGEQVEWGGSTNPDNSTNPGTGPGTGSTPGEQCMAGWSAAPNPLEWVLTPIKCAFVWAFVPRTQKVTEAQTKMDTKWRASTPGKLALAVLAVGPALEQLGDGNCGGLIVPVPIPGSSGQMVIENHAVLAACPGDFFAPFAPGFFWFNTLTLVLGGFFAVRRMLDRMVGNT